MRPDLDLVLVGATGVVGRLAAEHLVAHAPDGLRIGLAGRRLDALKSLRNGLGRRAADWSVLTLDSRDAAQVEDVVGRTRVVVTTVGPYFPHGLLLVEACARAGVHYADITGEVLFMRESIERCHAVAAGTGARIVHATGFDSVPSDLAVQLLAERVRDEEAGELTRATQYWRRIRGGFGAGTIASIVGQIERGRTDPAARRIIADPYALCPDRSSVPLAPAEPSPIVRRSEDIHGWTGPFVMGSVNGQVVRRSNSLSGWSYGPGLRYDERVDTGSSPLSPARAAGLAALLPAAVGVLGFGPTRALLGRVMPHLPDGPTADTRERGQFRSELHAHTNTGERFVTAMEAPYDPGYSGTAVMFGESALLLADPSIPSSGGGVLTPAIAFGPDLLERLRGHGFRCVTRRLTPPF